jgi:hypothetical protein
MRAWVGIAAWTTGKTEHREILRIELSRVSQLIYIYIYILFWGAPSMTMCTPCSGRARN